MPNSLFLYVLLGKTSDLAFAELQSLTRRFRLSTPDRLTQNLVKIDRTDAGEMIRQSGGIVKIYEPVADPALDLISAQENFFALSSLTRRDSLKDEANDIRKKLKNAGLKPHFRILETPYESAGITTKSTEYLFTRSTDLPNFLKAISAQNLDYWSKKDYGRPKSNPHAGMLPPKVARMMVNLGLDYQPDPRMIIYDPFCGSGTILVEALDLNTSVIGSDLDAKAISISEINCRWFKDTFSPLGEYRVFVADATHIQQSEIPQPVDAMVFEGYLGPPFPNPNQVSNLIKGLGKLYKGVFKHVFPYIKPGGKIVCALPEFILTEGHVKNLDDVIDGTISLGYTRCADFIYGRPQALVKRKIYILQKNMN